MTEPYAIKVNRCICTRSDCTYPSGECRGTCGLLHRVDASRMHHRVHVEPGIVEQRRPVDLPIDVAQPISRPALALSTYQIYRHAGRTRREAFRHALRVLRQRT